MRTLDIILSLIGLILLFILLFFIYILNLTFYRSPLFFQKRVGLNLKNFFLIKFRTMKIETRNVATHLVDKKNITTFGKFLRLVKLDELPQLWNVLIGDMSIVGPRPCLISQKKLIAARMKRGIYKAKPGITGLAQINGINMSTPELLIKLESQMIKEMNLFKYFYYIFVTIYAIFKKTS